MLETIINQTARNRDWSATRWSESKIDQTQLSRSCILLG